MYVLDRFSADLCHVSAIFSCFWLIALLKRFPKIFVLRKVTQNYTSFEHHIYTTFQVFLRERIYTCADSFTKHGNFITICRYHFKNFVFRLELSINCDNWFCSTKSLIHWSIKYSQRFLQQCFYFFNSFGSYQISYIFFSNFSGDFCEFLWKLVW